MTLPANSTFLPVLDDLLSPDFRPVLYPVQTPQTPMDPVAAITGVSSSTKSVNFSGDNRFSSPRQVFEAKAGKPTTSANFRRKSIEKKAKIDDEPGQAASKIQTWWKSQQQGRSKTSGESDIQAERAKHSIRHDRTEEHVRYLETEVTRLKSSLTAERKLRSLQLEAIKSLWNQVQRISFSDNSSMMTQSMPNGLLPLASQGQGDGTTMMSMSMSAAAEQQQSSSPSCSTNVGPLCTCSKEIQSLKENLSCEMAQLRGMIDQLRQKDNGTNGIAMQKRPLTLSLPGMVQGKPEGESSQKVMNSDQNEKEIAGYANEMASKLLEGAVDKEPDVGVIKKD